VRLAVEATPAGAVASTAAEGTAPAGAAATTAAGGTPADSAVAAAASAARVLLLRLLGGRPHLRGTIGVAVGSFTLFLLPSGRPRLRPPVPLGTSAPAPLRALVDDMEAKEMG
jgi:hypothetical protein